MHHEYGAEVSDDSVREYGNYDPASYEVDDCPITSEATCEAAEPYDSGHEDESGVPIVSEKLPLVEVIDRNFPPVDMSDKSRMAHVVVAGRHAELVGREAFTAHSRQLFSDARAGFRANRLKGEVPLSDEEQQRILTLQQGLVAACDEFGVDVRNRLTPIEDYHLFESERALHDGFKAAKLRTSDTPKLGGMQPHMGIAIARNTDAAAFEATILHESAHDLEVVRFIPDVKGYIVDGRISPDNAPGDWDISVGLDMPYLLEPSSGLQSGISMHEMVTDIITCQALEATGFSSAQIRGEGEGLSVTGLLFYRPVDALGDMMIRHTAREHGVHPSKIAHGLARGSLQHDMTALKNMTEVYGEEIMAQVLAMDEDVNFDDIQSFVYRIGGDELVETELNFSLYNTFDWNARRK